ncbi:MAG: TonB-dependent receptor [Bacteroidales bacterium]|nr:TonB-dependent receptor [Bacteroidales bacterium]
MSRDVLFSAGWDFYALDYCASRYTQTDGGQSYLNAEVSQLDNWTPLNTDASEPIRINGTTNGSQFSTRHAYVGDFLKMKNIKLSYEIPKKYLDRIMVNSCRLFIQGENIFVLTDMPNFDPEIRVNSYRYVYDFPSPRTYTAGININF